MSRAVRGWLGVAAVYLVGALVFWAPLPLHASTHVWGDRFDAWTTLWLMWHLDDRLAAGALRAHTDRILFPVGYNLWSFGHAALQLVGVLAMRLGVPLVLAYNLLLFFGTWTSALAAHLFGRELAGSHRAGFVAGFVFATSPYLYGEGAAGCVELVAAGLLPLHAWALLRYTRRPTPARALAATVILAVIGPFNWYYTVFAGIFGVMFALWVAALGQRRTALGLFATFAVAGLLDAPLVPLVRRETPTRPPITADLFADRGVAREAREFSDGTIPLEDLDAALLERVDALQVVQNQTPLTAVLTGRYTTNPLGSTPGALAWILGVAGAAAAGRRALGWLAIAAVATLLTLGPWMTVEAPPLPAWSASWPLPYAFAYTWIPFFSKAYRPYRIGVVALTALAAAASAGVPVLLARRGTALVALFGVVAFTQPFWAGERPGLRPLADAGVPAIYAALRDLPEGAVIELPLHYQPLTVANARLQYHQIVHRKPLLNCNQLIRRTDLLTFRTYVLGNRFATALLDAGRRAPPWSFSDADIGALVDDGFRYLVVHRRVHVGAALDASRAGDADRVAEPMRDLLRTVFGPAALADEEAEIYDMRALWTDRGRHWTWSPSATASARLPIDASSRPLRLAAGARVTLADDGREVAMWVRGVDGEVALSVRSGSTSFVPDVDPEEWRWIHVPVEGAVALEGPGSLYVAQAQVLR